jgi:hypothetical protein
MASRDSNTVVLSSLVSPQPVSFPVNRRDETHRSLARLARTIARSHRLQVTALFLSAFSALTAPAAAAHLKSETLQAFNRYVEVAEAHMARDLGDPSSFLWVDRQPEERRRLILALLREGHVVVNPLGTGDRGRPISIPGGLVHHWAALIFIPGVTLPQTLAQQQDYDHYQKIYRPDFQRSKLLNTDGRNFGVAFRLYRKNIVTAAYDSEFDIRYFHLDERREYSVSRSTRIAQVDDAGEVDEHDEPDGNGRGYLWRLNTYSRYEEKDGGVYIQIEFIALTRDVPAMVAWLVEPYIGTISREYLTRILEATRTALMTRNY